MSVPAASLQADPEELPHPCRQIEAAMQALTVFPPSVSLTRADCGRGRFGDAVESRRISVFDIDRFAAVCRAALIEHGTDAIREVVLRAVSEPGDIIAALGEQTGASAGILIRASDLTILNVVWGARQWTLPHNHHHRAIIGMYDGGEDNIFWRRLPNDANGRVEAAGAASLRRGDVTVLGRDIIHSVTNPLDKLSYALHVYDGDFLAAEGRSCWDAETLAELPYDAPAVSPMFGQALATL